jgi:hypothetical protein
VDTTALQADSVTSAKVLDDTLTASDIAANAVAASELADNSVDANALQTDSVTSAKIASSAVGASEIRPSGVSATTVAVSPGTVQAGKCKVSSGSVTGLLSGDLAIINTPSTLPDGFTAEPAVQDTNGSLKVRVCNFSGTDTNPGSQTFSFTLIR